MATIRYVVRQILWMMHCTVRLLAALSTGLYWVVQLFRLLLYSACMLFYLIPHAWWYLTSPNVIRRVNYRYSTTTTTARKARMKCRTKWPLELGGTTASEERGKKARRQPPYTASAAASLPYADGGVASSSPIHSPTKLVSMGGRGLGLGLSPTSRHSSGLGSPYSTARGGETAAPSVSLSSSSRTLRPGLFSASSPRRSGGINPASHSTNSYGRSVATGHSQPGSPLASKGKKKSLDKSKEEQAVEEAYYDDDDDHTGDDGFYDDSDDSDDDDDLFYCNGSPIPPHPQLTAAEKKKKKENAAALRQQLEMETNNRATLDVVLPVPLDVVMMSLDYSHRNHRLRRKKFPVAILVTGGAWIIGSQMWSSMLARVLAARGYVVFCPDYRNFPQTNMEGMTLDVSDAIGWVLRNADRYNGDLDDVTLVGQSAGAHLTMMSLLSQAHLAGYEAKGGKLSGLPSPSGVAYNVPRYNPRQTIHRYIGLSGIYNLEEQAPHLHQKGLNRALLSTIAGGRKNLPRYSINSYFDARRLGETGEVLPDNFFDFLPFKMFFLHGDADETHPTADCANLVLSLRQAQCAFTIERTRVLQERRRHEARASAFLPGVLLSSSESDREEEGRRTDEDNPSLNEFSRSSIGTLTEQPLSKISTGGAEFVDVPSKPPRASSPTFLMRCSPVASLSAGSRSGGGGGGTQGQQKAAATATIQSSKATTTTHIDRSSSKHVSTTTIAQAARHGPQPAGHEVSRPYPPALPCPQHLFDPIVSSTSAFFADPLPPCEVSFILIPGSRHTDAVVEECLSAGRSCCADFLCDYDECSGDGSSSGEWRASLNLGPGSTQALENSPFGKFIVREHLTPRHCGALPDGLLPMAVPAEERSWLMRWCSSICPF